MRASDQIIHKAAWLYYTHNMRQEEVAKALNISRASVAAYLRRAREAGVVSISASTRLYREETLARRLEDGLGLRGVWIVPDGGGAMSAEANIPFVAANAFLSLIGPTSRIGVAWGRTIYHVADAMDVADLQDVTVTQICGNLGAPYTYRPDQCTIEIARRLNARPINLYAPLVLSTEDLARGLRAERVVADQLAGIAECDIALFSVGSVEPDSHIVACGALSAGKLARMRAEEGAVGVIGGQLIDKAGRWIDCSYNRRLISVDLDTIRRIPKRFVVVAEAGKFEALAAAIRGGFVSHLVAPAEMGEKLLEAGLEKP